MQWTAASCLKNRRYSRRDGPEDMWDFNEKSESAHRPLDAVTGRSTFVPMAVETLGEAMDFSWRVTVRCAWGKRDAMKSIRECVYSATLDLPTLVWTRGRDFPLARLESRLKCPRCGSRRVRLAFSVPAQPLRAASK